jgi:phage head maturation protease
VLRAVYKFLSHREAKLAARMADEKAFGGVSVGFLPGRRPQHNTWSRDEDGNIHVVRHEARLLHVGMVVTPAVENAKILQVRSMGVPEDVLVRTPRLDDARKILERIKAGKVELP